MKKILMSLSAGLILTGCSHTIQATSGADYLNRYSESPAYAPVSEISAEIFEIANVEPDLRFPARIGLARIGSDAGFKPSQLMNIPADEAALWGDMLERQGDRYGEIIPVSPFIASMVSKSSGPDVQDVVSHIRKGAARQHLDYVLVYEVTDTDSRKSNGLQFTDATVLGLFLIPSRNVEVDTIASAVLIDVRNGYPYATATSYSENSGSATRTGSSSKRQKLEEKGRMDAVSKLTFDVESALQELKDKSYQDLVAEGF